MEARRWQNQAPLPPYALICGRTEEPRPYRVREIRDLSETDRLIAKYKLRTDFVNFITILKTESTEQTPQGMAANMRPIVSLLRVDGEWIDIQSAAGNVIRNQKASE